MAPDPLSLPQGPPSQTIQHEQPPATTNGTHRLFVPEIHLRLLDFLLTEVHYLRALSICLHTRLVMMHQLRLRDRREFLPLMADQERGILGWAWGLTHARWLRAFSFLRHWQLGGFGCSTVDLATQYRDLRLCLPLPHPPQTLDWCPPCLQAALVLAMEQGLYALQTRGHLGIRMDPSGVSEEWDPRWIDTTQLEWEHSTWRSSGLRTSILAQRAPIHWKPQCVPAAFYRAPVQGEATEPVDNQLEVWPQASSRIRPALTNTCRQCRAARIDWQATCVVCSGDRCARCAPLADTPCSCGLTSHSGFWHGVPPAFRRSLMGFCFDWQYLLGATLCRLELEAGAVDFQTQRLLNPRRAHPLPGGLHWPLVQYLDHLRALFRDAIHLCRSWSFEHRRMVGRLATVNRDFAVLTAARFHAWTFRPFEQVDWDLAAHLPRQIRAHLLMLARMGQ